MKNENQIEYLPPDIRILNHEQLRNQFGDSVPTWWHECAAMSIVMKRKFLIKTVWREFECCLPSTIEAMKNRLVDCVPASYGGACHLIYVFQHEKGKLYFSGGNPTQLRWSNRVAAVLDSLPFKLVDFYRIHNGWINLSVENIGISPSEKVVFLDEASLDLSISNKQVQAGFKNLVSFFQNGMGAHVAVRVNGDPNGDIVWFGDEPPILNIDPWQFIDAWLEICINLPED